MWRTTDINKIVNKYEVKKVYGGKRPSKIRDDGGRNNSSSKGRDRGRCYCIIFTKKLNTEE